MNSGDRSAGRQVRFFSSQRFTLLALFLALSLVPVFGFGAVAYLVSRNAMDAQAQSMLTDLNEQVAGPEIPVAASMVLATLPAGALAHNGNGHF